MEPLFPCYLFVRCVVEDKLDDLRYAYGVGALVNFGGRIARVPDEVVAELQSYFRSEDTITGRDELAPGVEVVVSGGAFEGMRASVLRVLPARRRVQLLLEYPGSAHRSRGGADRRDAGTQQPGGPRAFFGRGLSAAVE